MRLCKDCAHFGERHETCNAPQNMDRDIVTGELKPRWEFCSTHRKQGWISARTIGACGAGARWFKEK